VSNDEVIEAIEADRPVVEQQSTRQAEAKARTQRANSTIAQLAELFPQTFFVYEKRRKPIKVGIRADLAPLVSVTEDELTTTLGYYVRNSGYLRACVEGAARLDLAGNEAGIVTADEAEHAQGKLAAVLARRQPKTKPALLAVAGKQRLRETGVTANRNHTQDRDGFAALRAAAVRRREAAGAS
jgi:sRNA-binding protein